MHARTNTTPRNTNNPQHKQHKQQHNKIMEQLPSITEEFISGLIKNSQTTKRKLLAQSLYITDIIFTKDYTTVKVHANCRASMKKTIYTIEILFIDEDIDKAKCTCVAGYVKSL